MRISLALLAAPLIASANPIERRQSGLLSLLSGGKAIKPFKIEEGKPTVKREGVKTAVLWHGPYKLPGANETADLIAGAGGVSFAQMIEGFPLDSIILRTDSRLRWKNGTEITTAQKIYNHHVILAEVTKPQKAVIKCGTLDKSWGIGSITPQGYIGGSSTDGAPALFTTEDGSIDAGFRMPKDGKVFASIMLVNYHQTAQEVFVVTEVDYLPGSHPEFMDTCVASMSVTQCESGLAASPMIFPKEGQSKFQLKSKPITILQDGYLLQRKGHTHDGGERVTFKLNDKLVCDSEAIYGEAGGDTLSGMKACNEPIAVKKGDTILLEAAFDLSKRPAREHAHGGGMAEQMALMGFVFAAKKN